MKPLPEIRVNPNRPKLDPRPLQKRVGLIILATDHTTEPDFARMVAGPDIGIYVSRIHYANPTTPDNLRAMQPSLTTGAGQRPGLAPMPLHRVQLAHPRLRQSSPPVAGRRRRRTAPRRHLVRTGLAQ